MAATDIWPRLLGTLRSTFRINKATIDTSGLTAARTVTLPDASMTLAGINRAEKFTAVQTFEQGKLRLENRDADANYLLDIDSGTSDPGAEHTLSFLIGTADKTVTINSNVTLPQTFAAGPTLGQIVAAARRIARY